MMDSIAAYLTQSTAIAALILFLITFIESLALVGLLIPSAVIMTAVGILIAQDYLDFYLAWLMAFLGCFLGDGLSFIIGSRYAYRIKNWSWLKKHQGLINKTERSLINTRFTTLLLGRYIGVLRPIVPLLAGILNLPKSQYLLPSFIACLTWPILYLVPGIIAGAATEFPEGIDPLGFQLLLLTLLFLVWAIYFYVKKARVWSFTNAKRLSKPFTVSSPSLWQKRLFSKSGNLIVLLSLSVLFLSLSYTLITHPLFQSYSTILKKIFAISY